MVSRSRETRSSRPSGRGALRFRKRSAITRAAKRNDFGPRRRSFQFVASRAIFWLEDIYRSSRSCRALAPRTAT